MSASAIGVAIGLVLVFLLLSWLASGINELVEIGLRRRAKNLEAALADLLGPPLKDAFYRHPLIFGLYSQKYRPQTSGLEDRTEKNMPSYVSAPTFASVVLSLVGEPYRRLTQAVGDHAVGDPNPLSLHVGDGVGEFPTVFPFHVRIGEEVLEITAAAGAIWTANPLPSTTPARHPVNAVARLVRPDPPDAVSVLNDVAGHVKDLPPVLARPLESWLITAGRDLSKIQTHLEDWFNEKMERVSGWYKRKTQVFLLVIGLVLAVSFNADTLLLARTLWDSPNLRDSVAATAQQIVREGESLCDQAAGETPEDTSFEEQLACLSDEVGQLRGLGLPLGWPTPKGLDVRHPSTLFRGLSGDPRTWATSDYGGQVAAKLVGLLLTAFAISLGAPFWFDLLGRVVNLRASGRPPKQGKERT
jgi:hypothetical protein